MDINEILSIFNGTSLFSSSYSKQENEPTNYKFFYRFAYTKSMIYFIMYDGIDIFFSEAGISQAFEINKINNELLEFDSENALAIFICNTIPHNHTSLFELRVNNNERELLMSVQINVITFKWLFLLNVIIIDNKTLIDKLFLNTIQNMINILSQVVNLNESLNIDYNKLLNQENKSISNISLSKLTTICSKIDITEKESQQLSNANNIESKSSSVNDDKVKVKRDHKNKTKEINKTKPDITIKSTKEAEEIPLEKAKIVKKKKMKFA